MFGLLKKKQQGQEISLKISGMHCVSCSINIDGALEDLEGILEAKTNYASSVTKVRFNPEKVKITDITAEIKKLGYSWSKIG